MCHLVVDMITLYLYQRGFRSNYYRWVHHGETFLKEEGGTTSSSAVEVIPNPMTDMVMDSYAPITLPLL